MDKETRELTEIGKEINQVFAFVKLSVAHQTLTTRRIDLFSSYLRRTESLHPLIAPMEVKKTFQAIDIAKKRVEIIRKIMKQLEEEEKLSAIVREEKSEDHD